MLSALCCIVALSILPLTTEATPAFNWDFKTYYPYADTLQGSLTTQQQASINQLDGLYPISMVNATGAGLTPAELDEVAAMPAYFLLSRNSQTGELSGRAIVVDDESSPAVPDTAQSASFNGDFIPKVNRLCDLYAKATAAQAPQLEQVYSDLIEHFLDQNYLPGGQAVPWMGNGYVWTGAYSSPAQTGWRSLRMVHKLSADKRDLYSLNLAYVSGFYVLMANDGSSSDFYSSLDHYYNYYPTAQKALALMSDTPAKWQLMQMLRRGYDISIIGKEGNPKNQIVPLDGSTIHHDGHNVHYAGYIYAGLLQIHLNWTTAGITSPYTATTIDRLRKGSLAWCFATTGGLNPLHQRAETELPAANAPSDGGFGNGLDFALKAARLKSAYAGTSIADDLEMAYAAIAKTGVSSTSLPVEWRSITPPATIDSTSPLYTASLTGSYSHTTNGTAILRGPGQWYASLRGQPTHWRGGESRYDMGTPTHFNAKAMHGSMMLITTGKNGRKPNEVDSGYFRDGWDYSYYPNVTCPDIPLDSLLYWRVWAYFGGETNLTGSANLRDSGVWMMKGSNSTKSAFMLGNRIVLVNNNVTGSNLHTGLIQYGHNTPSSEPLVLDGASYTADGDWTLNAGGNHRIVDAQGNGYFVHAVAGTPAIKARRGNQSTTYALPGWSPGAVDRQ